MSPDSAPAGPAPLAQETDDNRDLAARVVAEPLVPAAGEADDAFSALATLLLDAHAARAARGTSPTPRSEDLRLSKNVGPDARCQEARSVAPPAGGAAA